MEKIEGREEYRGREWSCDSTHTRSYWGCFTCEQIKRGIDHRIDMGIEHDAGPLAETK